MQITHETAYGGSHLKQRLVTQRLYERLELEQQVSERDVSGPGLLCSRRDLTAQLTESPKYPGRFTSDHEQKMQLRTTLRFALLFLALLSVACGDTLAGPDPAPGAIGTRPGHDLASLDSNGDSIVFLGDITTTAYRIAMANGPFWHHDSWWQDFNMDFIPVPWEPPSGGGGGTSGTPADYTPWTATSVQDTLCQSSYDILATEPFIGQHGAISSKAIQDSLTAALAYSRSIDTEIGGYITRTIDGKYHFFRIVANPSLTDNCKITMTFTRPPNLVALWHTHPDPDVTTVICRIGGDTITIGNASKGGGSSEDWDEAHTKQVPMYTVDPNGLYRLDPGVTTTTARVNNSYAWDRNSSTCASRRQV